MSESDEWIAAKIASDPKVRAVADDARVFGSLKQHQGWIRLIERIKKEEQSFMLSLAQRLLKTGAEIPQREIDYMAGFYKGAMYVLMHPEEAEQSFERAARMAWVTTFAEHNAPEEGVSPYV